MVIFKHFLTVAEALEKFQASGFLCDAVLIAKCGGQVVAHSVILAAASPVFLSALESAPPEIPRHLYFPDVELSLLQIAVNFIYTGKLNLPTLYSHMDKLTTFFIKMSELGLNLQKFHGCEMAFIRYPKYMYTTNRVPQSLETFHVAKRTEDVDHGRHQEILQETSPPVTKPSDSGNHDGCQEILQETSLVSKHSNNGDHGRYREILPKVTLIQGQPENNKGILLSDEAKDGTDKERSQEGSSVGAFVFRKKRPYFRRGVKARHLKTPLRTSGVDDSQTSQLNDESSKSSEARYQSAKQANDVDKTIELKGESVTENGSNDIKKISETDKPVQNTDNDRYFCELCDKKDRFYVSMYKLWSHKMNCHSDVIDSCTLCQHRFSSKLEIQTHAKQHFQLPKRVRSKNHKCSVCDSFFHTVAELEAHKSKHTGIKPYECSTCAKKFTMRCSLERHKRLHSGLRPFLCDICGKSYLVFHKLSEHMLNAHDGPEGEHGYECAICKITFKSKPEIQRHALETHQLTHLRELDAMIKPRSVFLCDLCGKNFSSQRALKVHQLHHSKKALRCEICDKVFAYRSSLKSHQKIHSGEKPYVCNVCHKTFSQKTVLESHLATHSVIRPFVCIVCSKTFADKSKLNQHMELHSIDKAYTCGICHKQFATKPNFLMHNRIHVGDRLHICSVCGRAFVTSQHLKKHMRVHTGERPFVCEICDKSYKNRVDLRHHYTRFHKLDLELNGTNGTKYNFNIPKDNLVTDG